MVEVQRVEVSEGENLIERWGLAEADRDGVKKRRRDLL